MDIHPYSRSIGIFKAAASHSPVNPGGGVQTSRCVRPYSSIRTHAPVVAYKVATFYHDIVVRHICSLVVICHAVVINLQSCTTITIERAVLYGYVMTAERQSEIV